MYLVKEAEQSYNDLVEPTNGEKRGNKSQAK